MFGRGGWRRSGGILSVVFLGAALPAWAQVSLSDVEAEADRLHDRAMVMAATFRRADLPMIVELHQQSADLRHWKDPDAVSCLSLQGHLLHAIGKSAEARASFEDAAGVALARGELSSAADAFVDAAFAAEAQGRHTEAQRLARKAYDLTQSDELSGQDRRFIRSRLDVP